MRAREDSSVVEIDAPVVYQSGLERIHVEPLPKIIELLALDELSHWEFLAAPMKAR